MRPGYTHTVAKWKTRAGISLDEPVPGLFAFTNPAGRGKQRHSYFMPREDGNLLFHGPDDPTRKHKISID